jgi:hypothetical protein
MTQINPDPHTYGYVFVPRNRITSMFGAASDVLQALRELRELDIADDALELFVGEAGADTLDLPADHHGVTARRIRNMEAFMVLEAGDSHRRADEAMRQGGAALVVRMDGKEALKDAVVAVLHRNHAWLVRYWGRWSIESFD